MLGCEPGSGPRAVAHDGTRYQALCVQGTELTSWSCDGGPWASRCMMSCLGQVQAPGGT